MHARYFLRHNVVWDFVENFNFFYSLQISLILYALVCHCVYVGTTIDVIIEGLAAVTAEEVFGKFFSLWPKSDIKLGQWLDSWIKIGNTTELFNCNILI